MADGADPHRATGAPPRRGRGTPLRAGDGRTVAPLTAEEGIGLPRFGLGNLRPITNRFAPLRDLEDVAAGPDPAPLADVVRRRRRRHCRYRLRRSEAGSQASSSAAPTMDGCARDPGYPARRLPPRGIELETRWGTNESGQHLMVVPSHRRQSLLSQASSSAAPAPSSEQEERTCVVNSSEVDREVIEALSLRDPPLLTPQTETDEESTDDDCAWVPTTRQTKFFFNRPKGISRSMVLSTPLLGTIPNVKEQRPKLYSDVDPKDVQRMVKEYLDARPCINLDIAPDSILAIEEALDARAAELGTEPQLPSVITEQDSVAAAHRQHSMVPTESRHEASAEEIIPNGTAWMNEEVMLCFKKFIAINRHLAKLEDYRLDELKHQCFNVECYDKVYHHYNFTVRMKMPEADWKVKLYFAEVKEVFRKTYYLCYPLDPNENGQCYACKNQGVEDLRHPAIDLYEMGSPDASCNLWYADEEPKATRFESDSFDLGVLFGS